MDIQTQIKALENLAEVDAVLAGLEKELAQEQAALGGKQEQLSGLDTRLAAAKSALEQMSQTRNDLMTEARQMSFQIERSREKLGRCRTEREVNAAQREMEELRKLYRDREVEIQKLTGLAEQAESDITAIGGEREKLAAALGETQGDVLSRLDKLRADVAKRRTGREKLTKGLPPVLYRRYDRLRANRGTGIAHTTVGTCSACHIALAPMMFQTLRRDENLDQCPACSRILYYKAPPPEPSEEEAAAAAEKDA